MNPRPSVRPLFFVATGEADDTILGSRDTLGKADAALAIGS
jgi:hypothetical protein